MWSKIRRSLGLTSDPAAETFDPATGAIKPTKDSPKRIRILPGRDRFERRYAVTRPMGVMKDGAFLTEPILERDASFYQKHCQFTPATIEALAKIMRTEGVMKVNVQRYELLIRIGGAHNFDDVHTRILTAIRDAFFAGDDEFHAVEVQDWTQAAELGEADETAVPSNKQTGLNQ
jgi:hypothetical protein